jgi:hypothetical protein
MPKRVQRMTKTSTTKIAESTTAAEADSLPRISARELLRILHLLADSSETTLENIRLRLCFDKGVRRSGDALFSKARDAAVELDRLGLVHGGPYPKDRRLYERAKDRPVKRTDEGRALLDTLANSRAEAYDALFRRMYAAHRYLRVFVRHIAAKELFVPTVTSTERDVSERYARHAVLAEDVAARKVDLDGLIQKLTARLKSPLSSDQDARLRAATSKLVDDMAISAAADEATEFAKNFLNRLNDVVLPVLFDEIGLTFDYRTHRALWDLGEEFRLWWSTPFHPDFEGRIVFRTATLRPSPDLGPTVDFSFDSGIEALRSDFLARLFLAYQDLQRRGVGTHVDAWVLRAVFCHSNRCQGSVFNKLFEQQFVGDATYEIHSEIRRQWPQHEEPLRAGQRNIGTVRVVRK